MSAAPRQGSTAFTLVLGGVMAIVVGAIVGTFLVYPIINGFTGTELFAFETTSGARVGTFVDGMWRFTLGFVMLGIIAFVWIETRQ